MMTPLMHPGISKLIGGNKPIFVSGQDAGRAYARFWLDLLTPRDPAHPKSIERASDEKSG
jgi:hypothetical protein